ncbi:hypothetical protein [Zavarzinia sp. CC-PAN008]|uniref:hypothetical protein n=1 Tax=Zavarzinia sp. CC-PAN008 TaxID=3243332 RepID=UPI003F749F3E
MNRVRTGALVAIFTVAGLAGPGLGSPAGATPAHMPPPVPERATTAMPVVYHANQRAISSSRWCQAIRFSACLRRSPTSG